MNKFSNFIKNENNKSEESFKFYFSLSELEKQCKLYQNKEQSIRFKQKKEVEKQLIFENLTNDYPQKITYSMLSKDRILIQISGIQQGKSTFDRFIMAKK